MSEKDLYLSQINRLVASQVLHSSESLCKLLQYLAKHALDHPNTPLKEYQLATEVFGRRSDFDPQSDSTIRVQAGRLRLKLAEFYSSEGAQDPVIVELPKGTYILSFNLREASFEPRSQPASATSGDGTTQGDASQVPRAWLFAIATLSILLLVALVTLGLMVSSREAVPTAHAGSVEMPPLAFQMFWQPFVSGTAEPWLIFSNAAFVGRPETGMRYYNSGRDGQEAIWDHYSGVGEVLAVHSLDEVFGLFHRQLRVKRGSLFSLDDAKNNDLIFLGSPSENLSLAEIPTTSEFVFQRLTTGARKGDLAILNVHPQAGEATEFLASAASPLVEDYAVVGLVPGLARERSVLILAGTTTFGTQGAAEYVSRLNSVEDLLTRVTGSKTGELKPFEAVIHIKVARGVPVEAELVAVRKRQPR
jgi:hypothetical protein